MIVPEVLLAIWLISGWCAHQALLVGAATFLFFSLASVVRAWQGSASCGCFGQVQVSPLLTAVVDFISSLGLLVSNRQQMGESIRGPRLTVKFACIACLFASVVLFTSRPQAQLAAPGVLLGSGNTVLLQPEKWLGGRLPILSEMVVDGEINSGHWRIVLVRNGCDACSRMIAALIRRPRCEPLATDTQYVLIDVGGTIPDVGTQGEFLTGILSPHRTWLVALPTEIVLQDGIVVDVNDDGAS